MIKDGVWISDMIILHQDVQVLAWIMLILSIPAHGNWGPWGYWSLCSSECGEGIQERKRECDNPPPTADGRKCNDLDSKEQRVCQNRPCNAGETWWRKIELMQMSSWNTHFSDYYSIVIFKVQFSFEWLAYFPAYHSSHECDISSN